MQSDNLCPTSTSLDLNQSSQELLPLTRKASLPSSQDSPSQLQQSTNLLVTDRVDYETQVHDSSSPTLNLSHPTTIDSIVFSQEAVVPTSDFVLPTTQDILDSIRFTQEQDDSPTDDCTDMSKNKRYTKFSNAPVVIDIELLWTKTPDVIDNKLLWFQHVPTEEQQEWCAYMKKKYPFWANHISASNWLIGGEYSTYFTTIKNLFYPTLWRNRNLTAIDKWFDNHTAIHPKYPGGKSLKVSGIDCVAHSRSWRWFINLRKPRNNYESYAWKPYLFIAKSTIGCENYRFSVRCNADGTPIDMANDMEYDIVDPVRYANSGLGLFFNRNFKKYECIGLYCGQLHHKQTLADTGYNIDWLRNLNYVIDAKGGLGYPFYFGWHFANPVSQDLANVIIDADLRVFPNRDVRQGEEAFFFYGERRDVINNLIDQPKKKRRRN